MIIKCPYCGEEYLFEEIFVPADFKGDITNITKEDGKIIYHRGVSVADNPIEEEYTCDRCNKLFKVKATVDVKVEEADFDDEYTLKLC